MMDVKISKRNFVICHSALKNGFTLLEITLSISILILIGATSLVSFINSRRTRDLGTAVQNVLSVLLVAQSKTVGGEDANQWGVHLEQTQFTLFRGATYAGSTLTQAYALPDSIEIVNISIGGGSDVIFQKIYGTTNQSGTFDIRVKTAPAQFFKITIDPSGKVYQTGTIPAQLNTRIIDMRHRAFNLGWSIQPSLLMTLTFSDPPNPDFLFPVTMTTYFDGTKSKFDWSGTVAVYGHDQVLRIHTTSLTASNTILNVDRDCRKNSKKVKITIDTKDIATYETDCQTITLGLYGGTISEP